MKRVHFIAIGGAVMHQLALALKRQGNIVTGSDDEINDPAKSNLGAAGLLPEKAGWFPEKITSEIDAIVLGMHAKADNPELLAAQSLNVPIYSFPQYVYEVSKNKKRVVVAGSHGKTTITSMIMHILKTQNIDFDYLVGAKVQGFNESVRLSDAPIIILEGDEYPASVIEKRPKIFFYHPHISVLSGIAWDHINVFPTYDNYRSQFEQYLVGIDANSPVFYNNKDEEVRNVMARSGGHLNGIPYSMPKYHYELDQAVLDTAKGPVPVSVFGSHNLLNMQAAISVCMELGISEEDCYKAIASFAGAARRLEKIFENKDVVAFRDFAHAPSKLKATLDAVREAWKDRTLIACFELHTYSSLSEPFLSHYTHSMDSADKAMVYFSHHALSLKGLPELDKQTVHKYFGREDLIVADEKQELEQTVKDLLKDARKPICLLLMSSGTFDGIDWNSVSSQ
ncbi:UDP-N-acetylmuramate--L-alanine ligase [Polluticoccus soli]|uniref:UDP-N-acetylmuramate--L-alanine ligase n=1 Tax=Polluticoccus soli TaxID=3034150 RepID=UPI0023E0F41D|nr:Mur ligase family protein [Flavipsychrobacter sp. JY13-12]